MRFFSLALALVIVGLAVSGCGFTDERERSFNDDPKLEFFPLSGTVSEGAGTVTTDIQLIGPQRDSNLEVNFVVDESTTAEEGVHFTLPSTTATLEANSSSVQVPIQVLDDDLDNGDEQNEVVLVLQESDGVEPAENLKEFNLTIVGEGEGQS